MIPAPLSPELLRALYEHAEREKRKAPGPWAGKYTFDSGPTTEAPYKNPYQGALADGIASTATTEAPYANPFQGSLDRGVEEQKAAYARSGGTETLYKNPYQGALSASIPGGTESPYKNPFQDTLSSELQGQEANSAAAEWLKRERAQDAANTPASNFTFPQRPFPDLGAPGPWEGGYDAEPGGPPSHLLARSDLNESAGPPTNQIARPANIIRYKMANGEWKDYSPSTSASDFGQAGEQMTGLGHTWARTSEPGFTPSAPLSSLPADNPARMQQEADAGQIREATAMREANIAKARALAKDPFAEEKVKAEIWRAQRDYTGNIGEASRAHTSERAARTRLYDSDVKLATLKYRDTLKAISGNFMLDDVKKGELRREAQEAIRADLNEIGKRYLDVYVPGISDKTQEVALREAESAVQ